MFTFLVPILVTCFLGLLPRNKTQIRNRSLRARRDVSCREERGGRERWRVRLRGMKEGRGHRRTRGTHLYSSKKPSSANSSSISSSSLADLWFMCSRPASAPPRAAAEAASSSSSDGRHGAGFNTSGSGAKLPMRLWMSPHSVVSPSGPRYTVCPRSSPMLDVYQRATK